ncbi:hypothetical protein WA158_004201 [Blastocystis sp. Blastoise]
MKNCCGPKLCKCCAITFLAIPVAAIIALLTVYFIGDSRVERIAKYNKRVEQWTATDYKQFKGYNFNLTVTDENMYGFVESSDKTEMEFYPTRDSCKVEGDPSEGCIDTPILYYKATVPTPVGSVDVTIAEGMNVPFIDESFPLYTSLMVYNTSMECDSPSRCTLECIKQHGTYSTKTGICKIKSYLASICYRVAKNATDGQIKTDVPPTLELPGYEADNEWAGCYGDKQWYPAHYVASAPENITIELRYYSDPYIAASAITDGCSTSLDEQSLCMGLTRWHMGYYYIWVNYIFLAIAGIDVALYILAIALEKKRNANKNNTLQENLVEKV